MLGAEGCAEREDAPWLREATSDEIKVRIEDIIRHGGDALGRPYFPMVVTEDAPASIWALANVYTRVVRLGEPLKVGDDRVMFAQPSRALARTPLDELDWNRTFKFEGLRCMLSRGRPSGAGETDPYLVAVERSAVTARLPDQGTAPLYWAGGFCPETDETWSFFPGRPMVGRLIEHARDTFKDNLPTDRLEG